MNLSLRRRLLLGNIALLALSLLVFAAAARVVTGRVMRGAVDRALREQALGERERRQQLPRGGEGWRPPPPEDPLGRGGDGPPPDEDAPFPTGNDRRQNEDGRFPFPRPPHFGNSEVLSTRLIPADRIAQSPSWSQAGAIAAAQSGQAEWRSETNNPKSEPLRVFSLPLFARGDNGPVMEVVQTAAPIAETDAALQVVSYSLGLLLPVIALLAGGGGFLLTRRALSPVRRMTDAAAQIEASRLSEQRLPEPGGNDEFDQLARMLNNQFAKLDDAFARQKRFTAHASHELRTPLAVIKTALTMLAAPGELPPTLRDEAIRSANEATDRTNRLISDLLFLTRTENKTLPVRAAPLKVRDVLQTALDGSFAALHAAHGQHNETFPALVLDAEASLCITSDRDLLLRLVGNLLDNALRHTPAGGTVRLCAQADKSRQTVEIRVTDTGCGIAAEHMARLGQPFYRPDVARTRTDGGAGLGLSLCYGIANALGGSLRLESRVGKGTTAIISLPVAPSF